MKSTQLTQGVSLIILAIYIIYALFALPFSGFLLSVAAGMISFGVTENFESTVAIVLLTGVLFSLVMQTGYSRGAASVIHKEGFADQTTQIVKRVNEIRKGEYTEGFLDGAEKISERVERIKKATTHGQPRGVYASAFVEGFADAGNSDVPPAVTSGESKPANPEMNGAGSGIPPATPPPAASTMTMPAVVPPEAQKKDSPNAATGSLTSLPNAPGANITSGFRSGGSGHPGQFKLGEIPDEKDTGFHIDQGTTVLNALNALKPDQVKQMSEDTQRLIDTQKSLMSLLGTMKPMLTDGRQMLDTFQQMFGNGSGETKTGMFKLGN
jgi:hypothetical protein